MLHVCENCGLYRPDKIIDPEGPFAICPECSHAHRFRLNPLLIIGGASGTGKSALCAGLAGDLRDAVLLDADILWRPEFNRPEEGYRDFFDVWLRLAVNIGQSGRPVVLFGAGFAVPNNLETSVERRYFSTIRYLALVCDDEVLANRLHRRPGWREAGDPGFIEEQKAFNRWFKAQSRSAGQPPITLLETDRSPLEETVREAASWILANLGE